MKYSFNIKSFLFPIVVIITLSSCMTREKYERPRGIVSENLFRTDRLPKDSLSTGTLSWREIFSDPVLQQHIQKGLENNIDVRIALQNIVAAEAYLKQSKAAYLPSLSVGPGYSLQTPSLNTVNARFFPERRFNSTWDITGSLSWEADLWGKFKGHQKSQLAQYLATVAGHKAVKSDLVSSIASGYYQLLTYDDQKKIINETIAVRKKNLETTKALKESGMLTEVAVQQSEALVFNAESLLISLDVQIYQLENAMSFLMGIPSQKIERTTLQQQKMPAQYETGFAANLLANRADVMQAEQQLISAFELTNAAKAQFYPSLRVSGSGGLQSLDIDHLFNVNSLFANVVGGLTQPIFNGRQIRTGYEVSLANKEKAYLSFRKTLLNAGREVSDALKMYDSQDAFIALKKKELNAYKNSVEFSQELVNYGMANYLEVLNASVNSLNAELNISNAQYSKMKAGVDLYHALGGGWQ